MLSFLRLAACGLLSVAAVTSTHAAETDTFPKKPLHLLVNGAPGNLPDLFARPLADKLRLSLGQAVIVENRPGAGGIVAMRELQAAPADGHTLALVTNAHAVWNKYLFSKLPYDPLTDLQAVSPIATISMAMVVNNDLPATTLPQFVDLAKQQPGALNYASSSVGSPPHVMFELFNQQAGIDVLHVPFRSGPDAMNSTLSGRTHAYLVGTALVEPLLKDGRARALAASPRMTESPALAVLPTFKELGFDGFEDVVWLGIVARTGVPSGIVATLNRAIGQALQDQDTAQRYATSGSVVYHSSPEDFARRIRDDHVRWKPVIEQMGVKLD